MSEASNHLYFKSDNKPIYAWTKDVPFDDNSLTQLQNVASLPFIFKHVAAMPDVHLGYGATVGSVIPTKGAVIPSAVGVDIGCGMAAIPFPGVKAEHLGDSLKPIRQAIEDTVPVGFASHDSVQKYIDGRRLDPTRVKNMITFIEEKHPGVTAKRKHSPVHIIMSQYGTLGGGNHFIELCLDESDNVWLMLHSGSRGIGNCIGQYFINLAKEDMRRHFINLPDMDLAYIPEGTVHFDDYMYAVSWAQDYAHENRRAMADAIIEALRPILPPFEADLAVVNCHHNYVERENHYGENILVTRKGAVRARLGDWGIIPGSMGARSFIVRGKGSKYSFHSCSHGAGRVMSRKEAFRKISIDDHKKATEGVECRKDKHVLDESPAAYKDIDKVMAAQSDLVEIVHTLKQVVCVKG